MKLHNFFRSGTSHRLRIALNLKGLAYDYVAVDLRSERAARALIDPYSSAVTFTGWRDGAFRVPAGYDPLPVSPPETWLLQVGWMIPGGGLDPRAIPGALPR